MSNRAVNIHAIWRCTLLGGAMAGALLAPAAAPAAVPPTSNVQAIGNPTASKLVEEARKAMQTGNLRLAMINLKNAVTADPTNGAVRAQLGMVLMTAGDDAGAERELRQARKDGAPELIVLPPLFQVMLSRDENLLLLNQFPDPGPNAQGPAAANLLKARAMALQALQRPAEAVDAMDHSLALRRDAGGLLARARLAQMQGNAADAAKFADEAIQKSDTAEPMIFKVGLLLAANDKKNALDLANQLLAKYPGNIQGRYARIEVYLDTDQTDKAKAEVDDILSKSPNNLMATYFRAVLLAKAGDAKGAWNYAQSLPAGVRDSQPRIALMVAQIAINSGNEDTGASILNRLLSRNPKLVDARLRLARIRLKQNNPGEALAVLAPVKDAGDLTVTELLANVYLKLNRRDDALSTLKMLDAAGKGGADIKRAIAVLEIAAGQTEQGIKDLAPVVAKNPTDPNLSGILIDALVRTKRFPEALAVADRLSADPKQRSTAFVYRGGILFAQNNMAGAQAAFDKAVQADPKNTSTLYSRASFLASTQKSAEASRDLRAILALDAKNVAAYLKLADIAAQQNQDQNVRSLLGQAIAAAPDNAQPRVALARYLILRRDFSAAMPVANELIRTQPTNTDGVNLLGQAQFGAGQKKEAIATYRRLTSMMPTAAGPQVLLGNALLAAGDRVGAASAMATAVKLDPASPEVRVAQVMTLLKQGDNDGAVASARAFQAAMPGTQADVLLADTLEGAKLHDQATAVLTKSQADRPSPAVLLRLVRIAMQANDSKRGLDLMSNWLTSHPADGAVRLEYATLLMQQENNSQAIAQYQTILKQEPNNAVALNNLGWMIQDSDPKRSLALLTQAHKLAPNSGNVADTLGWVKLQQKDVAGALPLLNQAHALQPRDGAITYHLAVALDANAKRNEARGLLKSLLDSNVQFKERPAAMQLSNSWR